MGPDRRVLVVASAGAIVLGAWGLHVLAPQRPPEGSAIRAAIADVEAGRRTTPLVTGHQDATEFAVTFLARQDGNRVPRIVSDITGWGERVDGTFDAAAGTMTPAGSGGWYSLEARAVRGARIEYLVSYGVTDFRRDPYNPRHVGPPQASEFVTPGYTPPHVFTDPQVEHAGALNEFVVHSRALRGACRVLVYTPFGYHDKGVYPLAVVHDRPGEIVRQRELPRILDWLVARGAIDPLIAMFVDAQAPGQAPRAGAPLRAFLTQELLAWAGSRYAVTTDPRKRAILAVSYGAKDALDAALDSGFDRLGLLIPGHRITQADIDAIPRRAGRHLRVAILAGAYDEMNVGTARGLRRGLAAAGHAVEYIEVPEGHSPVTWVTHLPDVLVSLFDASQHGRSR